MSFFGRNSPEILLKKEHQNSTRNKFAFSLEIPCVCILFENNIFYKRFYTKLNAMCSNLYAKPERERQKRIDATAFKMRAMLCEKNNDTCMCGCDIQFLRSLQMFHYRSRLLSVAAFSRQVITVTILSNPFEVCCVL